MSSFYADNNRPRPQANSDQYLDFGYNPYGSKDARVDELNNFGELPTHVQPGASVHRNSMDQLLNMPVYSVEEQQPSDFENAHFNAAHMKFHRMTATNETVEDHESRRRNSNTSSLFGEIPEDLHPLRYDSTDDHSDFEHHLPARRVHSLPDVERSSHQIFHTRSLDAIAREQHYMVRQSQHVSPSPQPLLITPPSGGQYHQQQGQPYGIAENPALMMDPRKYHAETFDPYVTTSYPKKPSSPPMGSSGVSAGAAMYNLHSNPPSYADPRYAGSRAMPPPPSLNNPNQGGSQYSNFVQRIPSMLNTNNTINGGGNSPGGSLNNHNNTAYTGPASAGLDANSTSVAAAGLYGNHQHLQQSRGGITTNNGGWLNLTTSRGQLLIGSNQGRGVYSERSSSNLIGAGLYEGTGSVYVVQLKCQFRHYVLDPRAPQYLNVGDFVIVDADRGEDLGIILEIISMKVYVERQRSMHISLEDEQNEVGRILREASMYERDQLAAKYQDELMVIDLCKNLAVNVYQMQMVVVDAEYQFDRHKLTVYYDSSLRIDFRELVRDLFAAFKTRIWFKKANNRYFKAKQQALTGIATGNYPDPSQQQQWPQQQQR